MTDRQIIEDIKGGNSNGITEIYKQYRNEFFGWLLKNFKCPSDEAKDIYQCSMLILYKNISDGTFEGNSSIKTYLFGIGKNQYLKKRRENNKFVYNIVNDIMDDAKETLELSEQYEQALETVYNGMNLLGDPCKKLLELSYFYKNSVESITVTLGYKNTDTTKNLKYKCLQRLRHIIQINFGHLENPGFANQQ